MTNRNLVLGLLASLLIVAAALGLLWVLERGDDVALPDEVLGIPARDADAGLVKVREESREEIRSKLRHAYDYNSDRVGKAYDADAATRFYADFEGSLGVYTVLAVATDTGPLIPESGFDDPDYTGLTPRVERVTFDDDVECLLARTPLRIDPDDPEGAPEGEVETVRSTCQRTSGGLTVRVTGGGDDVTTDDVLKFLDAVWDEVA